jgi:hypothetical protein
VLKSAHFESFTYVIASVTAAQAFEVRAEA